MQIYDVAIIGAGPAGALLARNLSRNGFKVVLVDRVKEFEDNNFSGGASLLEVIDQFDLPQNAITNYWDELRLTSPSKTHKWSSDQNIGVVFDFSELRKQLALQAQDAGATILLGHKYLSYEISLDQVFLKLEDVVKREEVGIQTKLIVDATGHTRSVIGKTAEYYVNMCGMDRTIRPKKKIKDNYLEFLIGKKWAPEGFSWIMPKGNNTFLIGHGELLKEEHAPLSCNFNDLIEMIVSEHMGVDEYEVIRNSGGTASIDPSYSEIRTKKRLLAIGDSISSLSPLGGEGIRHAFESAMIAQPTIEDFLNNEISDLSKFESDMQQFFDNRNYKVSERLSRLVYTKLGDKTIDFGLEIATGINTEDIMKILFKYDFKLLFNHIFDMSGVLFSKLRGALKF